MIDPDIREKMERGEFRPASRAPTACVQVEATADEAIARKTWFGDGPHPRTGAPDWTGDEIHRANVMVRAALGAEPGSLHRVRDGQVFRYRRGPSPSNVEVV